MEPLEQMDGRLTLRILPYLVGVMAWLSGKAEGPPKKVPLLVPEHLRVFVAAEQRAEQRRRQRALEAAGKRIATGASPAMIVKPTCEPNCRCQLVGSDVDAVTGGDVLFKSGVFQESYSQPRSGGSIKPRARALGIGRGEHPKLRSSDSENGLAIAALQLFV